MNDFGIGAGSHVAKYAASNIRNNSKNLDDAFNFFGKTIADFIALSNRKENTALIEKSEPQPAKKSGQVA